MEIKTITRIYDDRGNECDIGDTVLLQTKDMDDVAPATIQNIMTHMAVFLVDDKTLGFKPVKARIQDIESITLYKKKKQ